MSEILPAIPASPAIVNSAPAIDDTKVASELKSRLESSKRNKKKMFTEWKRNVELRLGKGAAASSIDGLDVEDDQSVINPDWSLTKTKTANLYSQVPSVQITHENKQYAAAIPPFAKALNYELSEKRANIGVAMEEVLNDVVNASGIGGVFVGYAARFETVNMPVEETFNSPQGPIPTKSLSEEQLQMLASVGLVTLQPTQRTVSYKFFGQRISPWDLLWPTEFTGSNFDDADFVGYTGRDSWATVRDEFKLTKEQKLTALEGADETSEDSGRSSDVDKSAVNESKKVKFDRIFYWRYRVDPEEKSFASIWQVVYVHGIDKPVLHEPWKGQQQDLQTHKYVGATKFPLRILTLTYVTDNPVPPSDSAAGRPQVNDLRRSRSQMFENRKRSIPIRWFDVNRVDPLIQENLMRGTWQGMIPTNGDGSRTIGEIARASYPSEDLSFDRDTKTDLMEAWQVGPNQAGSMGSSRTTKAEVETVQSNFSTRIGQERARVAAFFLGICEVLAGWMVLYSDFPNLSEEERGAMQQAWNQKQILHDVVLKIRPDAQVVLDTSQKLDRIFKFINMTVKSGYINPKPLLIEACELSGIDPSEVIIDPQPPTDEPNISYRFTGKDDLMNPIVVAMLIKKGDAPSKEEMNAAKQLLLDAQQPPPVPLSMQEGQPPPIGPDAAPAMPGSPAGGLDAHPEWSLGGRIAKRTRDI